MVQISNPNNQNILTSVILKVSNHCFYSGFMTRARVRALGHVVTILTSRSCTGRSSNRCCSSHAGYRTCAMTSGRVPTVQKVLYGP